LSSFLGNFFSIVLVLTIILSCGFEIKEVGQWGNYQYIEAMFKHHKWPDYQFLIKNGKIKNEEQNVARCWILAQKPIEK